MLKGNNFFHATVTGNAVDPQSISNATVAGNTISEPWKTGRQISFLLLGGDFAATGSLTVDVQGQRIDTGAWENLKEDDGTTDLEFTQTSMDDGGTLENGSLLGTIDVSRLDGTTYKAIRLNVTEENTAACLFGAAYVISDLYAHVSGETDDLFSKTVPA